LLVDDDAETRALLGLLSHIEAPDVILLDYKMPMMNGSQFLARKRWNPRLRCIPVVLLSAWTREWTGTRLDAVEVLSKPVDLERLSSLVTLKLRVPKDNPFRGDCTLLT